MALLILTKILLEISKVKQNKYLPFFLISGVSSDMFLSTNLGLTQINEEMSNILRNLTSSLLVATVRNYFKHLSFRSVEDECPI